MKRYQLLILSALTIGFIACSSEEQQKTDKIENIIPEVQDVLTDYHLINDSSSVT